MKSLFNSSRRGLLGLGMSLAIAPAASIGALQSKGDTMTNGRHDFAFQTGDWRVHHRKLQGRLVGSTQWVEFHGTCRAWEVLDGQGNFEEHRIDDPAGAYGAAAFRQADLKTGEWSIWWFDPRQAKVDPPVRGNFRDGVGTFLADDELAGRPIKVRFIWSAITATSARWEQAFSGDDGRTWEVNWIMTFERVA